MVPTASHFKKYLLELLKENPKTSWGKKELALYIEQLYSEFLELHLEGELQ